MLKICRNSKSLERLDNPTLFNVLKCERLFLFLRWLRRWQCGRQEVAQVLRRGEASISDLARPG
jgi:hypothetical protein